MSARSGRLRRNANLIQKDADGNVIKRSYRDMMKAQMEENDAFDAQLEAKKKEQSGPPPFKPPPDLEPSA